MRALSSWIILSAVFVIGAPGLATAATPARPNILWLTSEDNGPQLGCYGDTYATTPHLDALARRGVRYQHAWSNAPVCAPARTAIISGRFPAADGAEHMRSEVPLPAGHTMFPQLLRAAGYYTSNNNKEDYNLQKPDGTWNDSSARAHYRNRPAGAPFFAVFNTSLTHEGQTGAANHTLVHDPAKVPLPAYHPDTPEVRRNWTQYYDKITEMDAVVGRHLQELEAAGLADDTIVFYFGDHGAGIPRSKRWPYNSGLRVPLIVAFPKKFAHLAPKDAATGGASTRLVSFVDLAPTVLSIVGLAAPAYYHGSAFCGANPGPAPEFLHGFRGRMDERYDLVRSATDGRFVYLRHYLPHLPYTQHVSTMFRNPTMQAWERAVNTGALNAAQRRFWEPKPVEELYDLSSDPYEVNNLAPDAAHPQLARLRAAADGHLERIQDLGPVPEAERVRLAAGRSPRDTVPAALGGAWNDLVALARRASDPRVGLPSEFLAALDRPVPVLRYWGIIGLRVRGAAAVQSALPALRRLLQDESPSVRIAAADVLARFGDPGDLPAALEALVVAADPLKQGTFSSIEALNVLDDLGPIARPVHDRIAALPRENPATPTRVRSYPQRLITKTLEDLDAR